MEVFDATQSYVRFNGGQLSTEYRYPRRISAPTSIRLASGPTWVSSFTGSGTGSFISWWHAWNDSPGTVTYTCSGFGTAVTFTGSGTAFDASMVGQFIVANGGRVAVKVTSVASPTSAAGTCVMLSATGTHTGVGYRIGPGLANAASVAPPFTPFHGPFESVEK